MKIKIRKTNLVHHHFAFHQHKLGKQCNCRHNPLLHDIESFIPIHSSNGSQPAWDLFRLHSLYDLHMWGMHCNCRHNRPLHYNQSQSIYVKAKSKETKTDLFHRHSLSDQNKLGMRHSCLHNPLLFNFIGSFIDSLIHSFSRFQHMLTVPWYLFHHHFANHQYKLGMQHNFHHNPLLHIPNIQSHKAQSGKQILSNDTTGQCV